MLYTDPEWSCGKTVSVLLEPLVLGWLPLEGTHFVAGDLASVLRELYADHGGRGAVWGDLLSVTSGGFKRLQGTGKQACNITNIKLWVLKSYFFYFLALFVVLHHFRHILTQSPTLYLHILWMSTFYVT